MKLTPEQQVKAKLIMQTLAVFSGCTPAQLEKMAAALERMPIAKNKVIMMEQEISRMLYLLVRGKVGVWKRFGGEKKLIATLQAPDFFGENSMFIESPASALVKAEEEGEVLTLSRGAFDALAAADPTLAPRILENTKTIAAKRPTLEQKSDGEAAS